ncbi:MAG: fibronectin type III domain-containing protein [Bacteroidales bacterium]|jgi:uncharacterized protein (TIGR02145 family)|nr:fibronectin type III domain-containing protein [Bacteroidales bacterium]
MRNLTQINFTIAALLFAATTIVASCDKNDENTNNAAGTPGAVQNFTAIAGDGQVSLTWEEPSDDGGEEVIGYEITADNWTNKVTKSLFERSHIYLDLTNGTEYTFKVRAENVNGTGAESTAKATPKAGSLPESVVINGVEWATRNVDAPGTFAATPYDAGMLYNWDSSVAWSSADPVTSIPAGLTWGNYTFNLKDIWNGTEICPQGYRLPTMTEIDALLDQDKVKRTWVNSTAGRLGGCTFTDKTSGNSIFMPDTPARGANDSKIVKNLGTYWLANQCDLFQNINDMYGAYLVAIEGDAELNTTFIIVRSETKRDALTVRPVKAN